MSSLLDLVKAAKASDNPGPLVEAIPYVRWLGVTIETVREGTEAPSELLGRMSYHPELIGNASVPALHGGTIGALLEITAIFEVLWRMETAVLPKTIGITVQYLRPGRPMDVFARARLTRQGRRVANVRAEAWQDDPTRPIAAANGQFLVLGSDGV